ncbi:zinc finger protein c3h1 type-like 1 [Stylonychia lemnae]|uniref:Zinc finger protein c3h1 type-like 1 n=1 Tax=Stylonychia lemnae TaxID=5949 RepID=A0A078B535_STYLE|nr:zinc finger protein c3h1 type-like 1 [Stylonychia lemnae]|eukprot:CDW89635.1 zinc finger protein c3h1 type-like 1 [Stylonychia lemnae]
MEGQQQQQQPQVMVGQQYQEQFQQQFDPALMQQQFMQMPNVMMGDQMMPNGMMPFMPPYQGQPAYGGYNQYQMPQQYMMPQQMGGYQQNNYGRGGYNKVNPQKFKTVLCRHFENNGSCSLNDRCSFAHGSHEIRGFTDVIKLDINLSVAITVGSNAQQTTQLFRPQQWQLQDSQEIANTEIIAHSPMEIMRSIKKHKNSITNQAITTTIKIFSNSMNNSSNPILNDGSRDESHP